jgi:hypothetical protein
MAVNLKHRFFMSQVVNPSMRRAERGSISWAIPSTGLPVYVIAKAAVAFVAPLHAESSLDKPLASVGGFL